jgi:GT2 family glycosyltransferase
MKVKLSIIIVYYKTPDLLLDCIRSIYSQTLEIVYEIIVVDNNSCDNSREILLIEFPSIKWIQNNENIGFSCANNIGISNAIGEYLLFLNSDTIILNNAINKCITEFENNKINIGILGCKLLNNDGTIQKSVYYKNASFSELIGYNLLVDFYLKKIKRSKSKILDREIKALMGSFLLIKRKDIQIIGCFDPDFFMYSEEFDLCRRFIRHGYILKYFEGASIIHFGGSSATMQSMIKQRYLSSALLFLKAYGKLGLFIYLVIHCINFLTFILVSIFLKAETRKGNYNFYMNFFSLLGRYLNIFVNHSRKLGKGLRIVKYQNS